MRAQLLAAIAGTICRFIRCDAPSSKSWRAKGEPDTPQKAPELKAEMVQRWRAAAAAAAAETLVEDWPFDEQIFNENISRHAWTAPVTTVQGMSLLRQTLSQARHMTQPPPEEPPLDTTVAHSPWEGSRPRPVLSLWDVDDSGRLQLSQLSWLGNAHVDDGRGGPQERSDSSPAGAGNGRCSCKSGGESKMSIHSITEAVSDVKGIVTEARPALVSLCAIVAAAWAWSRGSACGLRGLALVVLLVTMQTRGLREGFGG
ncbi:hypothetical protein JDV02_003028 [Purpureocillium takamizusanense]|uniref:Uncharacterized protein n=1 Tax=Purpureocillium takamizusanense TaxID=2060973 RepID=A0A9Q8QCB6_9HYPO|nr:uncharacterized protein JDV02_003028 [Purpureocillium takamizusanense]UNI16601.1 hypothetical protein JDV02_003028 [Purpureocillium takamizusanense]